MSDVNARIRAPFQFVPFSNTVLIPYRSADELPPHNEILSDLKSGEILVTLRAETPVFVSDGAEYPDKVKRFFRGANGKYVIPGSTLRGMLRENMQLLGLGVVRPGEDMEDERIYYRAVAEAAKSVSKHAQKFYESALGYKSDTDYSNPEKVRSGWIRKEGEKYVIYPTRKPMIRVLRSHPDVKRYFEIGDPLRVRKENARTVKVAYTPDSAKRILPHEKAEPGMEFGTLLYTGRPVRGNGKNKKQNRGRNNNKNPNNLNHLYLFPEPDEASEEAETLREEDRISYQADWERRQNVLGRDQRNFWKLPQREGERKPVFYVRTQGRLYFGMSLFLRIGYPHSLAEGLPDCYKENVDSLDYPRAILGFATQDGGAYRSRVSVGDMEAVGNPREGTKVSMILGNPKPSWYPGYTQKGEDYTQDNFRLRGYKQYWLKETETTSVKEDKEKVGTAFYPLPKGTEFQGVVRYRNLTETELGLLLWCLRLEDGCFQTIGMGKPYGYGRVKLTISRLREWNPAALYGADLEASPWDESQGAAAAERIARYIAAYDSRALTDLQNRKNAKKTVSSFSEIQDFFFIKRVVREAEEVSYLKLEKVEDGRKINEYTVCKNVGETLPTLEEERKKAEERARKEEAEAPKSMEDLLQALKNKYGGR